MRKLRVFGVAILFLSFFSGWLWMDYKNAINSTVNTAEPIHFEINKGDSLKQISYRLKAQDLIQKPYWFSMLARLEGVAGKVKTGEYVIHPGVTQKQLLSQFVTGEVRQYSITLTEGWAFKQVLAEINRNPAILKTLDGASDTEILSKLEANEKHPEGLFFPDTYFFTKNTLDIDLLKRAYQKMKKILASEWANREENLPLKTPYEALILASIVEKETGAVEERPIIAGVFIRRLNRRMLLQTDPTVIYGMGDRYDGDIRWRDLKRDTPYNTYVRRGLPPSPIAMPGADAIHSTLHPEKGDSLYFVARGDGSHIFSSNLKEHNRAVDRFQRNRKSSQ